MMLIKNSSRKKMFAQPAEAQLTINKQQQDQKKEETMQVDEETHLDQLEEQLKAGTL